MILLPPNRVWRTYQGGRTLDALAKKSEPVDAHFPEDWIGSVTRAVNPGRADIVEGISQVLVDSDPQPHDFAELLASDPVYFLGARHVAKFGPSPMLLVKFLDPSIRLHFQAHPTADFARRFLNSSSGKTEAYYVLSTRPEIADPYIYLGFQRPPSRAEFKRLIESQDIPSIESLLTRVLVKPGDTYIVPGGVPHALGEGIFLVEIQEPSDLVVRFEFERGGYVLPESARFMNRGIDFCLDIFDYSAWTPERVAQEAVCRPQHRRELGTGSFQDDLIGIEKTPCFRVAKTRVATALSKKENTFSINIVTTGSLAVTIGGDAHLLRRYDKFFLPAGVDAVHYSAIDGPVEFLECFPPSI
jgi:mannose-6-phosphate isomerase